MRRDPGDVRLSCPFCREAAGLVDSSLSKLIGSVSRTYTDPSIKDVLFVPDRVPLCRDHVLICPRTHVLSISEAIRSTPADILQAINYVRRLATLQEGILVFEHGMADEDAFTICIDHAHLHVCPVTEGQARAFMESATRFAPTFVTQDVGGVSEWAPATVEMLSTQRGEYAAFSYSVSGSVFAAVAEADRFPSQFFRLIAAHAWQLDGSEEEDSVRAHRIVMTREALIDAANYEMGVARTTE